MINILIVDDHEILQNGLKLILEQEDDFCVIGLASNGLEAFEFCKTQKPDIVIMDIRMETLDGISATRFIKELDPSIKVLALTTFDNIEYIVELIAIGVDGYILKAIPDEELFMAIRSVYKGFAVYDNNAKDGLRTYIKNTMKKSETKELSDKEIQIVKLIYMGKSNREIANEIGLAEGSVKNIISSIFTKLGVKDRIRLVQFVEKNRMLEIWKV